MIRTIDRHLCSGCGFCDEICPMDVIRMKKGKAVIAYPRDCQSCFLCVDCPWDAIDVTPKRASLCRHPYFYGWS